MKLIFRVSLLSGVLFLTSCLSTTFYQIYKATSSGKTVLKEGSLIYEDENCLIAYDLWSEGGDIGFTLTNKTSKNIYLNLEESFFILNGIAHNYYLNRIVTYSENAAVTVSQAAALSRTGLTNSGLLQTGNRSFSAGAAKSFGHQVSYAEEKVVCIPPGTSKKFNEYLINDSQYRNCNLFKYPTKKQIATSSFTKADSPLVFSNRISYSVPGSDAPVKVENEFYVSEIMNLPETEATAQEQTEFCDQKGTTYGRVFKNSSPDKFYFRYVKKPEYFKH